jgi:hypothetical protein
VEVKAPTVWLVLHRLPSGATTEVGVDYATYCSLDERGFIRFYRRHVSGASRKEARAWARRQIEQRAQGGPA